MPLLEAIGSNSHGRDYEVIVIDDHSTDGTWEELQKAQSGHPLKIYRKQGAKGKAQSLIEGFRKTQGNVLAYIDADMEYPPEEIFPMVDKLHDADVIVANRKVYEDSVSRKLASRIFKTIFGKILFGMRHDTQSGLKVFKKEVLETVKFEPKSAWSFDLEFLARAHQAGFEIKDHDILFKKRRFGVSKLNSLSAALGLALNALSLRLKGVGPQNIGATGSGMEGAGVGYKGKKYITHTTLGHKESALVNLYLWQKLTLLALGAVFLWGLFQNTLVTLQITIGILSFVYFVDVVFNLFLVLRTLKKPPAIKISDEELTAIDESKLPTYTILCPVYREAHIIPNFVKAVSELEWNKNKLDVILLIEEDDRRTIEAVKKIDLPEFIRAEIVPDSAPKTKPKACNWGLAKAKGDYLVIYDVEDIPEPKQLKKAYLAFGKVAPEVICLQAKLNYYNPHDNILTRLFTAEYSLWFDVILTGLQTLGTCIPLGGTSNHFKTKNIRALHGWDPFNVTEDADLGLRLFKKNYKTAVFDSTTFEEANSRIKNWIRQRSRWIKGYMQTYLVHTRQPLKFISEKGYHALIFQLLMGGKVAFILINPFLWIATLSYFLLNHWVGDAIESVYPGFTFYTALVSLVFGNFLFMYYYMIGLVKRNHWELLKYLIFVPFYWILVSWAGYVALRQLIIKPHYWEKTVHGINLLESQGALDIDIREDLTPKNIAEGRFAQIKRLKESGEGAVQLAYV